MVMIVNERFEELDPTLLELHALLAASYQEFKCT